MFNDILSELIDHPLLGLAVGALGEQLWMFNFDSIDTTFEDADLAEGLTNDHIIVLHLVTSSDEICAKRVPFVFTTADEHNQAFRVATLVGMQEVNVGVDGAHINLRDLAALRGI